MPAEGCANHRAMPFYTADWSILGFDMEEGEGVGGGGILEPITYGYRGQLYYVLDMLKLLIYSVCGICMPIFEGVLRANDLT